MSNALLEHHLRSLRLPTMLANYRRLIAEHSEPLSYLADLAALESAKRQENGVKARIDAAQFPTIKTIEAFDFSLQAQLPKAQLLEHFDGRFVDQHRNVVFTGPPGTGKSHLPCRSRNRCLYSRLSCTIRNSSRVVNAAH